MYILMTGALEIELRLIHSFSTLLFSGYSAAVLEAGRSQQIHCLGGPSSRFIDGIFLL